MSYHSYALSFLCPITPLSYNSYVPSFICPIIPMFYHSFILSFICPVIPMLYQSCVLSFLLFNQFSISISSHFLSFLPHTFPFSYHSSFLPDYNSFISISSPLLPVLHFYQFFIPICLSLDHPPFPLLCLPNPYHTVR